MASHNFDLIEYIIETVQQKCFNQKCMKFTSPPIAIPRHCFERDAKSFEHLMVESVLETEKKIEKKKGKIMQR